MQTESQRNVMSPVQPAMGDATRTSRSDDLAEDGPTDDDLELIDLRYEQFVAQSHFESLMYAL
jgi:hypothetical protein